jgi:uncharacterized protein (DUF779 family)
MRFPAGEFTVGDVDRLLGEIEGCPFYIDSRLYEAWNNAELIGGRRAMGAGGILAWPGRRNALRCSIGSMRPTRSSYITKRD